MDHQPRAGQRHQAERDVADALGAAQLRHALQQHGDHHHADADHAHHDRQDQGAGLVLRLGPGAGAIGVAGLGQPPGGQQVDRGPDAPAQQPARDAIDRFRQQAEPEADHHARRCAAQQPQPPRHLKVSPMHALTVAAQLIRSIGVALSLFFSAPIADSRGLRTKAPRMKIPRLLQSLLLAAWSLAASAATPPMQVPDTIAQRAAACIACHGQRGRAPDRTATTRASPASPPATCTTSCSTSATAGAHYAD